MSVDLTAAFGQAIARAELGVSARGLDVKVRFVSDEERIDLLISSDSCRLVTSTGGADITVRTSNAEWGRILASLPPPRYNCFTALQIKNDAVDVSGAPLIIAQSRAALERIFEGLREPLAYEEVSRHRDVRQICGRYAPVVADGVSTDIYFEEAGSGPPVVLLHTAGADSRQYTRLLADTALAKHFRMIAFDMPGHGRSFPSFEAMRSVHNLTQAGYVAVVDAFISSIIGEPVLLTGCSMGAAISLALAAERPELLRGVIALEPPLKSPGRSNPYLVDVRVANGSHNSAYVAGLMCPSGPSEERARAEWIYAQAAPGIYSGDLTFYSEEFDGFAVGPRIETSRVPVHLMTGEYDYSATPADGERLSRLIPGSSFEQMSGLGHFPMTENPDAFIPRFAAALARFLQ
ncbi:alpha/beta fold hydrolase [Bradyrhizobium sp. PRIMUS42]|uniref:alpha/beta fold hydrolase n=1 Tax=Bradyrhizobium sp. PRIMUS42 TaxID=2908926 RepID=UPI001FF425AD|nr:alpha/beta hydrolase [Bradyrhizobium sp. PRIMUS42]MCJ9728666.1 alpha/beta hydrolase [Bradyrhizobium sp. PRIMUS42]